MLYSATCKQSGLHVALKLYRKPRLSDLNWFQVSCTAVLCWQEQQQYCSTAASAAGWELTKDAKRR